jgi:hypothetical protein
MIQPLDMLVRSPGVTGNRTDTMICLANDIEFQRAVLLQPKTFSRGISQISRKRR